MAWLGLLGIAFFLAVTVGGVIGLINAGLPAKVRELRDELRSLKERIERLESGGAEPLRAASEAEGPAVPATHETPQTTVAPPPESTATSSQIPSPEPQSRQAPRESILSRVEGRFASYWTGILGVLALVAGFSFLAVLTALRMGEFPRFLMLTGIALIFWVGSLIIQRRSGSSLFAAWFRSAAGALFLFACIGSASVPWLRWIESAPQGYALLAAGLLVNLYFALNGPYQLFASFHTLISLTALAVAPPDLTVLTAAALVAGISFLPSLRRPWGLHLLLSEVVFFAFIAAWVIRQPLPTTGTDAVALTALLAGLAPLLCSPYLSREAAPGGLDISARGAAWLFLALATVNLGGSFASVSLIFGGIAVLAYLPARFVASAGPVVRRIDSAAGLFLAALAALGLVRLELELFSALIIALLISLLFAVDQRKQPVPAAVALGLGTGMSLVAALAGVSRLIPGLAIPLLTDFSPAAGTLLLAAAATAVLVLLGLLFHENERLRSLPAVSFALLGVGILALATRIEFLPVWLTASGGLLLPLIAAAILISRLYPSPLLAPAAALLALASHGAALASGGLLAYLPLSSEVLSVVFLLLHGLLMVLASQRDGRGMVPVWPGVLLMTIDSALIVFLLTERFDPWATLSLWALEAAGIYLLRHLYRNSRRGLRRSLTASGGGMILFTALLTLTVTMLGEFESAWYLRYTCDLLVAAVLLLWARRSRSGDTAPRQFMLIAAVLFVVGVAGGEAGREGSALSTLAAATVLLAAGRWGPRFLASFYTLSAPIFWIGLVLLPLAALDFSAGRISAFSLDWWLALISGVTALCYLGLAYGTAGFNREKLSSAPAFIRGLGGFIADHQHRLLFLPLFISMGVFFYLSAQGPVLTSLFILMSFALFSLGIVLTEKSFRPFAYALLLFSLVRLVLLDMAAADTLERALVFIIAGTVLLGMNWIYNRMNGGV